MACIPCIAIPILLVIWRFLVQPLLMKWWQFRNKQISKGDEQPPELVKECRNGICTLTWRKNQDNKKTD